jgi:hypothetical protein
MSHHPSSPADTAQIPQIQIPASPNILGVRVIDTTLRMHMPVGTMFEPTIKGHTKLASPSYSFLVENEQAGRKVLFVLGVQKNWEEQAPVIVDYIKSSGWESQVEKDVAEILGEHKVSLTAVEAIIWG